MYSYVFILNERLLGLFMVVVVFCKMYVLILAFLISALVPIANNDMIVLFIGGEDRTNDSFFHLLLIPLKENPPF